MEDLIPVHVAVLLITDTHTPADEATVKAIIDRLTTVGHQIVECEVVKDSIQLVRAQFLKWIAESGIDVVIAIAGIETESTRTALQPLISKPLDGFSELVRMISFEEIGTGAMLVDVTAAQCSSTFVFVLPASGGAVRSALDKILIPQLDNRTKPRNLVSRMPRMKHGPPARVAKPPPAVPVAIKTENTPVVAVVPPPVVRIPSKTQIGPAVPPPAPPPRPTPVPASAAPSVVVAADPAPATAPQRPTPVPVGDAVPTPVPASTAPQRVTPVASMPAQRVTPVASMPAQRPTPIPSIVSQGTARADWVAPKYVMPPVMPTAKDPPERPAPWITPKSSTPTPLGVPIGIERKPAVVEPKPAAAAPADTDGGWDEVPIAADPRTSSSAPIAVVDPKPAPIPVAAGDPKPEPVDDAEPAPSVAVVAKPPASDVVVQIPPLAKPADPEQARVEPKPITSESSSSATGMALPRKRPKTDPPPLPKSVKAKVLVDDALPIEDVTDLATLESAPRPAIKAPVLPIDLPKPRAGTEDRVFGDRELAPHRKRRKKSKGLLLLGCLALATSTFLLVLYLGHRDTPTSVAGTRPDEAVARIPTPPPPPPVVPPDAPELVVSIDAAEPVASVDAAEPVDAEPSTPDPVRPTKTPAIAKRDPRTPARPPTNPPTPTSEPDDQPKNPPPTPGCDEVSCILEKYARSCCARFKPADPGPRPVLSGVPEELDKAMIRAGVDKMRPVIIGCGEKAGVHGTVKVAVSVGASGAVDSANVAASPDPTLGECVAGAMRKISFGKTKTGGSFTYPFVF